MERCPQCGNPRYICQNDDNDIDFHVFEEECNATRKRAKHDERASEKSKGKPREGVTTGVEAYTYSGADLSKFREPYYEEQLKLREIREAERARIARR